jgi:hypothetical protein
MPHSCTTKPCVEIKSRLFQVHNRKGREVNIICCFEPDVLWNFKAFVAETRIWGSLKIIFLESMVHRLSVDGSFVHH